MENTKTTNNESFEELFLASVSDDKEIKAGEIISGEVIKIGRDVVLVDIDYKSEGRVDISEFVDIEGNLTVKVGDKVDVFLETAEDEDGLVIVSKEKADKLKIWDEIAEACERGDIIEGRVLDRVKGGLSVDIGVKAFLPGSQIDLTPVRDLGHMVGNIYQFKIIKFNKIRGNIVLSRRSILEQERKVQRQQIIGKIEEGAIVKGIIKNVTDYGAFVDLGGLDGLLHITDLSWKRVNHPNEILKLGEEIDVKVLKFDRAKERVSLGLKQMSDDPWVNAEMKYAKNATVKGKVVNLTEYGAFIEMEEGIEGLIHVSEMSWTKRVKHPSALLKLGEEVEAVVLELDPENRRMSLGLKQTQPNPWDALVEKYQPGSKISGEVRNITDFGVFVEVEDGIDGLVHVSDISWSNKVKNPNDVYKKGDKIEAVVLNVDPSAERFALGIKQLTDDPWNKAESKYTAGTETEGKIVKITDFGLFLEVEDDLEGLIHVSEIPLNDEEKVSDKYTVGDSVKAVVISMDPQERKLSLSIKAFENGMSQEIAQEAAKKAKEKAKPTLGDIMGDQFKAFGGDKAE
ncbi:MAG TPA: 30S ribosomal protein S1 [Oligoflexia bacterium]|nr:30S ribosomal protein S1 [Oligoflexia bacterium]HMR25811.1 30S ribosomal protein S1 [Oligoflexia bacterium]